MYSSPEAPAELSEKLGRYWKAIREQIKTLERQMGTISRIYHETMFSGGEEGMNILEKVSPEVCKILADRSEAVLQATEDMELTQESSDWERCLMISTGQKVREKVNEFYLESSRKRFEHIAQNIYNTLKAGETGILFIQESHRVQFPKDVEVFNIYPPVLDEIYRWIRDYSARMSAGTEEEQNSAEVENEISDKQEVNESGDDPIIL